MIEKRERNMIIRKSGGASGSGTLGYKISIPTPWAVDMGVTQDDRNIVIFYDDEKKEITIKKEG